MARYRGSKGSLSLGGNTVAQLVGWELDIARPWIDGTVMNSAGEEGDLDIPGAQGRAQLKLDYGDAAHAAILDMLVSNADATPLAGIFIVSGTGPKQVECDVLPTRGRVTSRRGEHIMLDVDLRSNGAITINWT